MSVFLQRYKLFCNNISKPLYFNVFRTLLANTYPGVSIFTRQYAQITPDVFCVVFAHVPSFLSCHPAHAPVFFYYKGRMLAFREPIASPRPFSFAFPPFFICNAGRSSVSIGRLIVLSLYHHVIFLTNCLLFIIFFSKPSLPPPLYHRGAYKTHVSARPQRTRHVPHRGRR